MSENMVDLQIKADISDLQKKTKEAEKGFKDVQKAMENLNKIKLSGAEVDAKREWEMLNKVLQSSTEYAGALQKQMEAVAQNDGGDKNTKAYTELEKKLREVNEVIKETEEEVKNMGKSADETGDDFKSIENNADKAGNEVKDLANSNLDNLSSSVNALQVAFGNLIDRGIRVAYNGIKNLAVSVKDAGQDFDEAIGTLKALYGDAVDEAGMQRVVDVARELGTTSAYSATEVAEAMRFMALAGYNAEETTTSISSALDLASASGEDFEVVASILVDGLKAFNMGVDESNKFANVLAQTAVSTNADVSDLGDAFKYAGALSGTFGYDIGDVAVALGAMAENGVKGSIAGTALRQIMTRLATNTSGARDEFEALGGQFYDAEGNARPLIDVLEDLRNGLAGATDEEKANSLATIGGQRAITGLSAVVKTSAEHWEYLKDEIADSEGAVNEIAQMRLDNFAGDVKKLSNNWEEVKLQLYDGVEPALRKTAQSLIKLMQSADFKKFIKQVSQLASEILDHLVGAIEFLVKNFDSIINLIKGLTVAMLGLKALNIAREFSVVTDVFKNFNLVLGLTSGSALTLSAGLLGIGAVIGASAIAIKALFVDAPKGSETVQSINAIRESLEELNEASTNDFSQSFNKLEDADKWFKQLSQNVDDGGNLTGNLDKVKEAIERINFAYGEENYYWDDEAQQVKSVSGEIDSLKDNFASYQAMKKLQSYLDTHQEEYDAQQEALQGLQDEYDTSRTKYTEMVDSIKEGNSQITDSQIQASANLALMLQQNKISYDEYENRLKQLATDGVSWNTLDEAGVALSQYTFEMQQASDSIDDLQSKVTMFDNMSFAIQSGDTESIIAYADAISKSIDPATRKAITSLDELLNQATITKQDISNIQIIPSDFMTSGMSEQLSESKLYLDELKQQFLEYGFTSDDWANFLNTGEFDYSSMSIEGENIGNEFASGVKNGVRNSVSAEGFIPPDTMDATFNSLQNQSEIAGQTTANNLANPISNAVPSIQSSLSSVNGSLASTSSQAQTTSTTLSSIGNNVDFTPLLSQLSTVETQTETTGTTAGTKLATSFGTSTSNSMATQIATLGTTMSAKMVGVTDGMNTSLNSGGTKIAGTMRSITSKANDSNVLTTALGYSKGMNYVSGVNSGLQSGLWNVQQTANQIAQTVDGALQKAWQIHSPSRVAYGIADFFMQGLNNGLSDSIPLLKGTAGVVANSITTGIELASDTLNNGALAIDNINATNDITSTFKNALREVQLVVNVNNDMDGREIAQRVSTIQGMEIKKAGI